MSKNSCTGVSWNGISTPLLVLPIILLAASATVSGLVTDQSSSPSLSISQTISKSSEFTFTSTYSSTCSSLGDTCPPPVPSEETSNMEQVSSHFVKTLSGVNMPKLIYGTAWKKERTTELVLQAVRKGFRGIDTACQPKHYHEPGVGAALKVLTSEDGLRREDLFIQTKFTSIDGQDPKTIPYNPDAELPETVRQSLQVSLRNLGVSYIDSLVMHSPMRTHRDTMEVWRVFESFVDEGKVHQLGISNCYSLPQFQKIFEEARIKPSVIQNRLYAESGFDKEIRAFCKAKGVFYQSFWTLTANPQILSSPNVRQIAQKYGKTSPQILFTYLTQTSVVTPLTGTTNPKHMQEDLETLDMRLTEDEMAVFDSIVN